MRYKDLAARNPCVNVKTLKLYRALYEGGETFTGMVGEFLPQNPQEAPRVYALRKASAYYRSYVGPIVDFFAAQLFAATYSIKATLGDAANEYDSGGYYAALKEDCDGNGTDLTQFMKSRFSDALIKGRSWILAELPEQTEEAPSLAAWKDQGLGDATLSPLAAEDVLDWEVGDDGALDWAIVYSCAYRRPSPRDARTIKTETWRVFDRENVETFQIAYDPAKTKIKSTDEIPSVDLRAHRFPRVPLIEVRLPPGLWLMARAADAQVEHFRQSSALSWATRQACYPMAVHKAHNPENEPARPTGAGYMHTIGIDESIEFIAPSTAPFEVIAKQVDTQKDEIHRIAQQMSNAADNSAASIGRSGESKAADATATEICLRAYGDVIKDAIEEVFELVSDARGETEVTFTIEGLTHFKLSDVGTMLDNAGKAGAAIKMSPTLGREVAKRAADLLLPDATQGVKDAIRAEIDASADTKDLTGSEPAPTEPAQPAAPPEK